MLKKMSLKSAVVLLLASIFMLQGIQNSAFGASKEALTKEGAREVLKAVIPDVKILSVGPAPVEGLWEVIVESRGKKSMLYVDSAKKNILSGSIINIATKTNLTKKKFDEINKIDTSMIPLEDALVMGDPRAKYKVIIFDDPDCPYCAKLHPELKQIIEKRKDIAFYLKMFPILQLHPQAYDKSKTIICEKSNEKAIKLLEDVYAKKEIPKPSCDTKAVDENIKLAAKLGINGTPTLVFDDGRVMSGAMKAEKLIKLIENK